MQLKVLYILEDLTQSGTFNTIIKERILFVYRLGLLDYGENHNHDYFGQY